MYTRMFFVVLGVALVMGCGQKVSQEEPLLNIQPVANEAVATESPSPVSQAQDVREGSITVVSGASGGESFAAPTVKEIQQALKNANLYEGRIDGDLGPRTKKAITDFQTQNGLKADGKVGSKTWQKLKTFRSAATTTGSTPGQE